MCARYNSFKRIPLAEVTSRLDRQGNLTTLASTCGLLLCTNGEATFRMANLIYHLRASDICLYRPATSAQVIHISNDFDGIVFLSTLDFVLPVIEQAVSGREAIMLADNPCISTRPNELMLISRHVELLTHGLRQMEEVTEEEPSLPLLRMALNSLGRSLILQVLFLYMQRRTVAAMPAQSSDLIVHRFTLDLIRHYKQQRSVEFYASRQHLTPRYFSSVVKERTGDPALQWIVKYVISGLKQSLSDPAETIKHIADVYHFPSATFLSRYFRQYTGMSPKTYRNMALRGGV